MSKNAKYILLAIWIYLFFIAGCGYDEQAVRVKNANEYQKVLAAETNDVLSKKEVFDLNDCIQIALKNSLQTKAAKIQQQIAKLERKVSFANFLPAINLDYTHTTWNKQPKISFNGSAVALQDKSITDVTWQFEMSIFDPSTWFLYAMHKRGEETAELVTKYTMQMTVLDVIINCYHCLTLEQTIAALQSQLNAADKLEKETKQLLNQGQIVEWQHQQAQVSVLASQTELNRTKYALKQAYADLLASMGLSPMAQIKLKIDQPLAEPNGTLEELVYQGLINNPQLRIADLKVAIEEEKVKVALAAFLPRISIFANRSTTSDSFQVYPTLWSYGFAATYAIFNGFANINEYEAAKERKKAAFVNREQQTLILILQIYKAYLNLQNAKDEVLYAQKSFDVAEKRFDDTYEKWKQGLVQSSDMLEMMANKDNWQTQLMNSNYNLQVCIATLQNVMGTTNIPNIEEKKNAKIAKH